MHREKAVSICMATFNGAQFIEHQLLSIVNQMNSEDELIICDDKSTDSTSEIIKKFKRKNIRFFINQSRLGHVKNFEKAIGLSSKEIIVLADQDDIWALGKLDRIVEAFTQIDNLALYQHSLKRIDQKENIIDAAFRLFPNGSRNRLFFPFRQIFKCEVIGCSIAFRKNICEALLPFPKVVYAHDHWIALNSSFFGQIYFSSDVLASYRLHDNNVTPAGGLPLQKKIFVRICLSLLLLICSCRVLKRKSAQDLASG